jgi:hypothetical protein
MMSLISGIVMLGGGAGGLWYCRPVNGQAQWFATAPVLNWLIPIVIVSALAVGVALIVDGVAS